MGFLLVTYWMDRDTHLDQGDDVLLVEGRYELLVLRLVTVLGSGRRDLENTELKCLGIPL